MNMSNVPISTGIPLTSPNQQYFNIVNQQVTEFFNANFKTLNKTHNKKYIRTLESLYIAKIKPNLNTGVPFDLDMFSF